MFDANTGRFLMFGKSGLNACFFLFIYYVFWGKYILHYGNDLVWIIELFLKRLSHPCWILYFDLEAALIYYVFRC